MRIRRQAARRVVVPGAVGEELDLRSWIRAARRCLERRYLDWVDRMLIRGGHGGLLPPQPHDAEKVADAARRMAKYLQLPFGRQLVDNAAQYDMSPAHCLEYLLWRCGYKYAGGDDGAADLGIAYKIPIYQLVQDNNTDAEKCVRAACRGAPLACGRANAARARRLPLTLPSTVFSARVHGR